MKVRALVATNDAELAAVAGRAIDAMVAAADVVAVDRLEHALGALKDGKCGLGIVGERLADAPGIDLVRGAHDLDPEMALIMVVEPGGATVGAAALSAGAADYVEVAPDLESQLRVRIREVYVATRTSARRERLLELQDALMGDVEPQGSLEAVVAATAALLDADAVQIWASTNDGHWHAARGRALPVTDASVPASVLAPMTGDPGESQAVLYVPKLEGDGPLDKLAGAGVKQVAVGCARAGEGTVVTLLAARTDGVWQRDDVRWITAPCSLLAAAVQRMRVTPGKATAARAESGLPGRHAFERVLAIEGDRAQRERLSISVAFFEADRRAEGSPGPNAVDVAPLLRDAGSRLVGAMRGYDFAADLGEGRFGVVLPGVSSAAAWGVAERLRAKMSSGAADAGHEPPSFSCGVATFPDCAARVTDLLDRADQALVLAKRTGKGQTSVAPRAGRDARQRDAGRRSIRR